ncbi:hypothetical protein WJX74_004785 [Apatococcus lobatus]|uniref:Uncharacterized protein n=1 Tax=Apatococcus lobatus TaxID=904363 RepID=A0AAW1QM50_9CHLO
MSTLEATEDLLGASVDFCLLTFHHLEEHFKWGNMAATNVANLKDLVARVWGNEVLQELEDEDFRRLQDGGYTSKLRLERATAASLIASGLNRAIVDVIVGRTSGPSGSGAGALGTGAVAFGAGPTQQLINNSRRLIEASLWHRPPPMQPSTHIEVHHWSFQQDRSTDVHHGVHNAHYSLAMSGRSPKCTAVDSLLECH